MDRDASGRGVATVVIIQMQPRPESSPALGFRLEYGLASHLLPGLTSSVNPYLSTTSVDMVDMIVTRRLVWLKLPSTHRRVCRLGVASLVAVAILAACSDPSTPSTVFDPSVTPTPTVLQPSDAATTASITPSVPTNIPSPTLASRGGCSNGIAVRNPEDYPGLVKDCETLIRSKYVLEGESRYPLSWTTSRHIYIWKGITIGGTPPRVTGLEMFFRGLVDTDDDLIVLNGNIPAELGDLVELQRLDLYQHELTGEIPASLSKLSNLEVLGLSSNRLTGDIPPSLGDLINLRELWLGYNRLTGELPDSLGNLTNLKILGLRSNKLTGNILASLGNLTDLEDLHLWGNQLTGEIPSSLGNLVNLRYLSLNDNRLTGEIPPALGSLTNLEALWLENNELSGEIPPSLGNLTKLATVELKDNRLTGCLPPGWAVVLNQDFDEAGLGLCHDPTPPHVPAASP